VAVALSWTSWPLRDDYPRSLALVGILIGVSVAIGFSFESAGFGAFSLAVLVFSLARYLAPTRYDLDERSVRVRFAGPARARPWSDFRAFYPHKDGVHLSPFPRPSPLDPFRGVYLRFAGNRAEVLAFVADRVRPRAQEGSDPHPGGA
jgi:hypothetical protein